MLSLKEEIERLLPASERIIVSNRIDKAYKYRKLEVRKIRIQSQDCFQISSYTERQVFQENVDAEKLADRLLLSFPEELCQMNVFTQEREYSFRMTKKGKLLRNSTKLSTNKAGSNRGLPLCIDGSEKAHNRKKHYLLEEGKVIPPLVDMGIFTKEGKVVRSMYDKYRQINRFVELVDDILKDEKKECINIIDFGCGKSYLTFILYYYIVEIQGKQANIIGLDLKEDVIRNCNAAAKKYGYEHLVFERGDINGYHTDMQVDMVVTLHACDTATDYALYNAVCWNAKYIMSVPCCQHEVNAQLMGDVWMPLTRYGIIKERTAALVTDAIRADMLTYRGYKTQVLEFVDFAHSPKNLLIRAVRAAIPKEKREKRLIEVEQMCEELRIVPSIYKLLQYKAEEE